MKNVIYSIWREKASHQYHHIHIELYSKPDLDHYSSRPFLSLTWQGDLGSDHWYAFKASCVSEYAGESGVKMFRLASAVLGKLGEICCDDIGAVIGAIGCDRMVDDRRSGQWHKIADVKPIEWKRFMSWAGGSCQCSVVAPDEETAVKLLIKEYASRIESGYGNYAEKLTEWIKAGSPVRVDDYAKAPEISDLETLIQPMKEKPPVEQLDQVGA